MSAILKVVSLLCFSSVLGRNLDDVSLFQDDLVVETSSGLVRGEYGGRTPIGNKPLYWFRSIPFAEPPVGNLRFREPVPVKSWSGIRDVSPKPSQCLQGSENSLLGSEDCLYIQIYTTAPPKDQKKLPVMVWIYGGAFFGGFPNFTAHSPDLLLDQDVIIASINYRLGIFGFLSTGDLVAPGNNGLKDQLLGLKWIKENIAKFGGDPDNITLFGQSAGAASIGYLLQTPKSQGLFHRAIMHSGSPLCLWSLSRMGLELANSVASSLEIRYNNNQDLVDGLRAVDAELLQLTHMSVMMTTMVTVNMREGLLFAPTVEPEHDGAILSGRSHQLLEEGRFHNVPIILGYTSLEARLDGIPDILRILLATYDLQPSRLVPIDMNVNGLITSSVVGRRIKTEYFGNRMIASSTIEVMEYISDDQFVRPIQETARLLSKKSPVYFYKFSHEGSLFGVTERAFPGVGHTEDLGYLFDFGHKGSEEDHRIRTQMVKLWSNFAKTGNPTPEADRLLGNIQWAPLTEERLNFLHFNRSLQVSQKPDLRSDSFWRNLYNSNGNPPYATY